MDPSGTCVLKGEGVKVVGVSPSRISIAAAACAAPLAARGSHGHSVTQLTLFLPSTFLPSTGPAGSVSSESDSSCLIGMFNVEQQNYFVRRIKYRQIH